MKFFVGAAILISFGIGVYVGMQRSEGPEALSGLSTVDDEIIDSIDISNWNTYRNETLGLELRYPQSYEVLEDVTDSVVGPVQLLIRIKDKETTGNTIAFHKVRSSPNKEISDRFDARVTSIQQDGGAYIINYVTGDAFSIHPTYIYPIEEPTSPVDLLDTPMDIIIAEVKGTPSQVNAKTTEEQILETLKFIK